MASLLVLAVSALQAAAGVAYFWQGDVPRGILFVSVATANLASIYIT